MVRETWKITPKQEDLIAQKLQQALAEPGCKDLRVRALIQQAINILVDDTYEDPNNG